MGVFKVLKRGPIAFPLALAAAIGMLVISESSYWQSVGSVRDLDAISDARTSIFELQQSLLEAESGQRGYLWIGRDEYLEPYAEALERIDESFRFLDSYYSEAPEARAMLAKLRAATATKLSELALTIRLHQEGRVEAGRAITLSDIGREQMVAIRTLSAGLLMHEARIQAAGREALGWTLMLGRIGVGALSAISLLALFLYLRQTKALVGQQLEMKRVVQAERDRLEVEVRERTAELSELTHHLQTTREDERNRLARNLHDELGSLLTSAKLDAARIRSRLADSAPEALERLEHLVGTLNSSIALGRRIIEDLRPSTLGNLGLVATLEILAREFADQTATEVHCALQPVSLGPGVELTVYRIVQEAVTNIGKHAEASNVWLGLASVGGMAEVTVRDDGIGFDTSVKARSAYGLVGMRFRVEAEGGSLDLESAPGEGTLIRIRLPEVAPDTA